MAKWWEQSITDCCQATVQAALRHWSISPELALNKTFDDFIHLWTARCVLRMQRLTTFIRFRRGQWSDGRTNRPDETSHLKCPISWRQSWLHLGLLDSTSGRQKIRPNWEPSSCFRQHDSKTASSFEIISCEPIHWPASRKIFLQVQHSLFNKRLLLLHRASNTGWSNNKNYRSHVDGWWENGMKKSLSLGIDIQLTPTLIFILAIDKSFFVMFEYIWNIGPDFYRHFPNVKHFPCLMRVVKIYYYSFWKISPMSVRRV